MKTKILIGGVLFLGVGVLAGIIGGGNIFAQDGPPSIGAENSASAAISFPVKELGNCTDKNDCKQYCDKPENAESCFAFAEKNNLMEKREIETARKFIKGGKKGPGGCTSVGQCEKYCDDMANIDECVKFAEENGIIPPGELAEAKKVQAALSRGVKPPPCKNKRECDQVCRKPENIEVCIAFARDAGLMNDKEKEESQKMLTAIRKGVKPPACGGKEECDKYCGEEKNFAECIAFAEAAGFMSPEEVKMAKKTGGKGPGGCRGKDECESFCGNPDNQEACFKFGLENDMIPEEDLKRMEEGKREMMKGLEMAPPEVLDCVKSAIGEEKLLKLKQGDGAPTPQIGDAMRNCFETVMRESGGPGRGGENREPGGEPFMGPRDGQSESRGGEFKGRGRRGDMPGGNGQDRFGEVMRNIPPEVRECAAQSLTPEKLNSSEGDPRAMIEPVIRRCFESQIRSGFQGSGPNESGGPDGNANKNFNFNEGQLPRDPGFPAGKQPVPGSEMMPRQGEQRMPLEGGRGMPPETFFDRPREGFLEESFEPRSEPPLNPQIRGDAQSPFLDQAPAPRIEPAPVPAPPPPSSEGPVSSGYSLYQFLANGLAMLEGMLIK